MKSILVIDDDAIVVALIVKLLKSKGFQAIGRSDGESGLELVRSLIPDLIVCDVVMPGMNGHQILETVRRDPQTVHIPFIFLTSKTAKRDLLEGIHLGADHYLPKPIEPEGFLATIAALFADLEDSTSDRDAELSPDLSGLSAHWRRDLVPAKIEEEYAGWWVAVEPDSQRFFLGKTRELAYQSAARSFPDGVFLYRQLGMLPFCALTVPVPLT
ncbi:PleD family two-component system response regulator [Synechococcus sp. PCC 7336]|uniref:response regulator n=1 Tax=Synechococcus sp. PCC 7336 TaxID=195250 RepID=UPI00034D3983|nr:response regulator [Synechococcus sp. PCC 7336]